MLSEEANAITINTGNLISSKEFKTKATQSPSEEVFDSVFGTFHSVLKAFNGEEIKNSSSFVFTNKDHAVKVEKEDRVNLKISVKVFLESYKCEDLQLSVLQVMKDLDIEVIDSLILALPPPISDEKLTLALIKPLWLVLEEFVMSGKVVTIGISDLDTAQLSDLYKWSQIKPSVNQVNLESCCVMPPEMTAFAKENDIQLLTHNDPKVLLPKEMLKKILEPGVSFPESWKISWIVRYSVLVKCRGIIQNKGYLLCTVKEQ